MCIPSKRRKENSAGNFLSRTEAGDSSTEQSPSNSQRRRQQHQPKQSNVDFVGATNNPMSPAFRRKQLRLKQADVPGEVSVSASHTQNGISASLGSSKICSFPTIDESTTARRSSASLVTFALQPLAATATNPFIDRILQNGLSHSPIQGRKTSSLSRFHT